MEQHNLESSSSWLDSQRDEQEHSSETMQLSLSMADAPALMKDAERVAGQLDIIYTNYKDTYSLLQQKGLTADIEAIKRDVLLVNNLRNLGRTGEIPAVLQRAGVRAKKYNKEMAALQNMARKYYGGHVGTVEKFARGDGAMPAAVKNAVKPQDLQAFFDEMFPESYVSQSVRFATGQSREELHWAQKVAMAPGVGLENLARSAVSLFNPQTYENFAITVGQLCKMSVQDYADAWEAVKFTVSRMDAGTQVAYGVSVICSMVFLYGGFANFAKVVGGLKNFARIKGALNAMYATGSTIRIGAAIGPVLPLAIINGILLNNSAVLRA